MVTNTHNSGDIIVSDFDGVTRESAKIIVGLTSRIGLVLRAGPQSSFESQEEVGLSNNEDDIRAG